MHAIIVFLPTKCGWVSISSELAQVSNIQHVEIWPFKGLVKLPVNKACLHISSVILKCEELFDLKKNEDDKLSIAKNKLHRIREEAAEEMNEDIKCELCLY